MDWSNYWATADEQVEVHHCRCLPRIDRNGRGIDGALLDLEYQRIELIKFNLFDNYTFEDYVNGTAPGREALAGDAPARGTSEFQAVGGDGEQTCRGELIRYRTLDGICNDIMQPADGLDADACSRATSSSRQTFPDLGTTSCTHATAMATGSGCCKPDPQVISRELLHAPAGEPGALQSGQGLPDARANADCDYMPAPFFNVLAAYWIQFMTHDWFSHLEEGQQPAGADADGLREQRVGNVETPLTPDRCRARLPARRTASTARSSRRRTRRPRSRQAGQGAPGARAQDHAQHQHGVVGCFADLRLRRTRRRKRVKRDPRIRPSC